MWNAQILSGDIEGEYFCYAGFDITKIKCIVVMQHKWRQVKPAAGTKIFGLLQQYEIVFSLYVFCNI